MIKILLYLLLALSLYSKEFSVCSYNVENLFDLNYDKTEYKEYIPNTNSNWNKKTFYQKISNISKVIEDLDCDILALQEIENKQTLQLLKKKFPKYKYFSFSKYNNASVGIGFLSKIEIIKNQTINVKFSNKIFRPILESTFLLENKEFKVFNNHWPSKRSRESYRIKYAKTLYDRLLEIPLDYDYILLGDFNSNYNEYKTIFQEENLNDAQGVTGINQVLNTTLDKKFITYKDMNKKDTKVHYNLWLDLNYKDRFSSFFRGDKITPDNILVPYALFDNKKISYIPNSFKVFKPEYLYKNNKIFRWKIKGKKHIGKGFSDHLPIMASFSTNKIDRKPLKNIKNEKINKISNLYEKEKLLEPVILRDVIVLLKDKKGAIIKQKNDRAIYIYQNHKLLKEGFSYNLRVDEIDTYMGLKEIKKFEILKEIEKIKEYKNLYHNKNLQISNIKNQNEIISNIKGVYQDKKLFFNNKSIKIYFLNKNDIPKNGSTIHIKRAQIGYYRDDTQLVIHNKSDINVN